MWDVENRENAHRKNVFKKIIKEERDNWDLCNPLGFVFLCGCFFKHWVEFGFSGDKFSGVLNA